MGKSRNVFPPPPPSFIIENVLKIVRVTTAKYDNIVSIHELLCGPRWATTLPPPLPHIVEFVKTI